MVNDIKNPRDVRLDAIRGLLLVVMLIDHLPGTLSYYVKECLGYVSAAEGFVFLSGYVAGLAYSKIAADKGIQAVNYKAFSRALVVYAYQFIALLFVLFLEGSFSSESLIAGAFFLYQPLFLDVLPMYCIFLLLTPFLIRQFSRNRCLLVTGCSAILWIAAQFGIREDLISLLPSVPGIRLGYFDVFGWQLLFIVGLFLGCKPFNKNKVNPTVRFRIGLLCSGTFALFFMSSHGFLSDTIAQRIFPFTDMARVGPIRLLNFGVIAFLVYRLLPKIGLQYASPLIFLGQHSLQVFTFHVLLVTSIHAFQLPSVVNEWQITIACLALLFLPAWLHHRLSASIYVK